MVDNVVSLTKSGRVWNSTIDYQIIISQNTHLHRDRLAGYQQVVHIKKFPLYTPAICLIPLEITVIMALKRRRKVHYSTATSHTFCTLRNLVTTR